jgi:hypothetical protein
LKRQCGLAAFGFVCALLVCRELQRGAVIDRWSPARHLALAAAVELIGGFIAGIEAARGAQSIRHLVVAREALRLPLDAMRLDAQPVEIGGDAIGIFLRRAGGIGIVIAQHELAAGLAGHQPVENGGARIADVDAPCGRGCEADDRHLSARPGSHW